MRYGPHLLEEILRRTDIVQLVGRRVKLTRKGQAFWGCCPFHGEKTASFKVDGEKRTYKCFGCGKAGDPFRWVMETETLSYPNAVEWLANKVGVELPQDDATENPDSPNTEGGERVFISYSHIDEALKDELLAHLMILKREGLISVWHDRMLRAGEHLDGAIEDQLKNSGVVLLLMSAAFISSDYCAEREMVRAFERAAEGNAKVITIVLRSCEWRSLPLKTGGKLGDFVALPRDAKAVTTFADHDIAWSQIVSELRQHLLDRQSSTKQTLKSSALRKDSSTSKDLLGAASQLARPSREEIKLRPLTEALMAVVDSAERVQMGRYFDGIPTGFVELDNFLGGFRRSELILVAGRQAMGKSSFAVCITLNAAQGKPTRSGATQEKNEKSNYRIAYFSVQISKVDTASRMLSSVASVPLWKIRNGSFSEDEWVNFVLATQQMSGFPVFLSDGVISVEQIAIEARRLKAATGVDLVVIDGIQHLADWEDGANNSNCRLAKKLKSLAVELDAAVVATVAVSERLSSESQARPSLPDIDEQGAISRYADVVITLHREEYYLRQSEPDVAQILAHVHWLERMERIYCLAELCVEKNNRGPSRIIHLYFDDRLGLFSNLAETRSGHGVGVGKEENIATASSHSEPA